MYSLSAWRDWIPFPQRFEMDEDYMTYGGWELGSNRASMRVIPFTPIHPGFAINTIFYAAILWLLWAAPGAIRRLRRKQRGLCIHCGYDLRGAPPDSANCPECGAAVRQSRTRQETVQYAQSNAEAARSRSWL